MKLKKIILMSILMFALLLTVRLNNDLSAFVRIVKHGGITETFQSDGSSADKNRLLKESIEEEAFKKADFPRQCKN